MRKLGTEVVLVLLVLGAGLCAGVAVAEQHEVLEVEQSSNYTMENDGHETNISFVVNNSGNQTVRNSTLEVVNASDELVVDENGSYDVRELESGEERLVSVPVEIPEGTENGNYTFEVQVVDRGNRVHDNATALIHVNDGSGETETPQSGDNSDADDSNDEVEGGGAPAVMEDQSSWWHKYIPDWILDRFF